MLRYSARTARGVSACADWADWADWADCAAGEDCATGSVPRWAQPASAAIRAVRPTAVTTRQRPQAPGGANLSTVNIPWVMIVSDAEIGLLFRLHRTRVAPLRGSREKKKCRLSDA